MFLPRLELATFRSPVRRANQQAYPDWNVLGRRELVKEFTTTAVRSEECCTPLPCRSL